MALDGIADMQTRIAAIQQRCNAISGTSSNASTGSTSPLGASAFTDILAAAMDGTSTSGASSGGAAGSSLTDLIGQMTNGATRGTTLLPGNVARGTTLLPRNTSAADAFGITGGIGGITSGITSGGAQGFVQQALAEAGKPYVFGAQANVADANPKAFDCAELVQWAAGRNGVSLPDGSWKQYLALKQQGALVPVDQAMKTPGALLFSFSSEPVPGGGRPSHAHVAISLGDGRTIEARGKSYGVGTFNAANRFQWAAIVPGLQ